MTFDSTIYRLDDWYTRRGLYNLSDGRMVLGVSPGEYRRHGAFAEYVAVPQHILYRVPASVSFEQAAMVEPVAVAAHAVGLTPIAVGDTAVVVGAGMIGLCLVQVLRAAGCSRVFAVDLEAEKLELARKLGADAVLDPQKADVARRSRRRPRAAAPTWPSRRSGSRRPSRRRSAPCGEAGRSRSWGTSRRWSRSRSRRW